MYQFYIGADADFANNEKVTAIERQQPTFSEFND
jgi:hypothetical protein